MAVNYIQLTGNMLAPELKTTQSGYTVANFAMVVKTGGENQDDMWVDVEAWGNLAENIVSSFPTDRKTVRVTVEGKLKKDTWEDKTTGGNRSKFYVSANNVAIALDYQKAMGVEYAGDNTAATTQTAAASAMPEPQARPVSEIAPGDAPF